MKKIIVAQRLLWFEVVLIICTLLGLYCSDIQGVEFQPDESQWIATSTVFEAFIAADFSSPVWNETYWTLTQPPVARYLIGLGRSIGGYRPEHLNEPWSWTDPQYNTSHNTMPSPGLLLWSRLPMAIISVVSIVLGVLFVSMIAGRGAGYLFLILCMLNPYFLYTLRRALGEAPLLLCSLLAVVAGYFAIRSWQAAGTNWSIVRSAGWLFIMGLAAGAAGASKLNGLAVVGAGVLLCLVIAVSRQLQLPVRTRILFAATAVLFVLNAATLSFVGLNPFLYPDAASRTAKMAQQRLDEMHVQQTVLPEYRIHGLTARVSIIPQRIFEEYAAVSFKGSMFVNSLLFVIGLWCTMMLSWRWLRGDSESGMSVVLVFVAASTALPVFLTPLDWHRYYLFPIFFGSMFIAIGMVQVLNYIYTLVSQQQIRRFNKTPV